MRDIQRLVGFALYNAKKSLKLYTRIIYQNIIKPLIMKPGTVLSLLLTILLTTGVSAGYKSDCCGQEPGLLNSSKLVPQPEAVELLELSAWSVLVY